MTVTRRPTFAGRIEQAIDTVVSAIASPIVTRIAAFNKRRLPPRDAPHPLLTGIHEPMTEELTLTDLAVEGIIPPELDGRYVRIGPNLFHHSLTVSWQMSIPRSNSRSSTFRSDSGKRTYISTTSRITSGDELK